MFKVKFKQKSINLLRQKMMWTGQIVTSCIIQGKLFFKEVIFGMFSFIILISYLFTILLELLWLRFKGSQILLLLLLPIRLCMMLIFMVSISLRYFFLQYNYYYFFHEFKFHSKLGNKYCCQPNCLSQRSKVLEESWKIWPRTLPWRKWPLCRR